MMNALPIEHFPLRAIGVLIYGRMNSSPILTAYTPEIADATVAMLNEMAARSQEPQQ